MRYVPQVSTYCRKKNHENDFALYRTEVVQDRRLLSLVMKYSTYDHLQAVIDC